LAEKGNANEIESFHNSIHNDDRNAEDWLWEYEGLDPKGYIFALLKDGTRIIGTQGMIPIHLSISGERALTAKSENSILAPDYRGGMHFSDLYEFAIVHCAEKGINLIWGFTTAVKVLRDKIHFTVHEGCIYESISVLDGKCVRARFSSMKWSSGKKTALSVFATLSSAYSALFRNKYRKQVVGYSLDNNLRNPSDMSRLYDVLRKKAPGLIHLDLDKKYVDWRISTNPNISYKPLYVYKSNELAAYCFLNVNGKSGIAYLTDFTFAEANAGDFLLTKIYDETRTARIGYISFMGNSRNPLIAQTFKHLKGYGFIKKKSSLAFIMRNIAHPDEERIYDIANWYVNGLWTEGYEV